MKFIPFIAFILFIGCSSPLTYENRDIQNHLSLDLPKSMVDVGINDPFAFEEFGDISREWYLKLLMENNSLGTPDKNGRKLDQKDIDSYLASQQELYAKYMESPSIVSSTPNVFGGYISNSTTINTSGVGEPIVYQINYLFTNQAIYQIHLWCPKNRYSELEPEFQKIASSFKLL